MPLVLGSAEANRTERGQRVAQGLERHLHLFTSFTLDVIRMAFEFGCRWDTAAVPGRRLLVVADSMDRSFTATSAIDKVT